jgi:hypothetical protein
MIRSALRQKSRWWIPISKTKLKARRAYKGPNKIQKWEYQCAHCELWWKDKEVAVDHIVEAGELRSGKDLEGFIEDCFVKKEDFKFFVKHVIM